MNNFQWFVDIQTKGREGKEEIMIVLIEYKDYDSDERMRIEEELKQ